MKKYEYYFIKQTLKPFIFFVMVLFLVIWLSQIDRVLDAIGGHSETLWLFTKLSFLVLPKLFSIILTVAIVCALLYSLQQLNSDQELTIFWSSGLNRIQAAKPYIILGLGISFVVLFINIFLSPLASRQFREEIFKIQGEFAVNLLQKGVFTTPIEGITVYIDSMENDLQLKGLLIYDERDEKAPAVYMSREAALIDEGNLLKLIMLDGNIQQTTADGRINTLYFEKFSYNLSDLMQKQQDIGYKPSDYYIHQLLSPPTNTDPVLKKRLIARGHEYITSSFYPFVFIMITIAILLRPHTPRKNITRKILLVISCILLVQIAGMASQNLSVQNNMYIPLTYFVPIATIVISFIMLNQHRNSFK